VPTRLPPGLPIVVNDVVLVLLVPSVPFAVTVAVYLVDQASGAAGTQEERSSRSEPGTRLPPASVSATSVTSPLWTVVPISVVIGWPAAPVPGVMASDSGSALGDGAAEADGDGPVAADEDDREGDEQAAVTQATATRRAATRRATARRPRIRPPLPTTMNVR
jgi:hypothetical protein